MPLKRTPEIITEVNDLAKAVAQQSSHCRRTYALTVEGLSDVLAAVEEEAVRAGELESQLLDADAGLRDVWSRNLACQQQIDFLESLLVIDRKIDSDDAPHN